MESVKGGQTLTRLYFIDRDHRISYWNELGEGESKRRKGVRVDSSFYPLK